MNLKFNQDGNISSTIELTYGEVKNLFGTSIWRLELLSAVLPFLKTFQEAGCKVVYLAGSFASSKPNPADIDVCVDITEMDFHGFREKHKDFFKKSYQNQIKIKTHCDLSFCDSYNTELLDFFSHDRNNNPRGLIKIWLFDIQHYD